MHATHAQSARGSSKKFPKRTLLWGSIIGAITVFATVTGAIHYSIEIIETWGLGGGHGKVAAADDYVVIHKKTAEDALWARKPWISVGERKIALHPHVGSNEIGARVEGLEGGGIELSFLEFSHSEECYRGLAICSEHGGVIDSAAKLFRLPDNTLLLELARDLSHKERITFVVAPETVAALDK